MWYSWLKFFELYAYTHLRILGEGVFNFHKIVFEIDNLSKLNICIWNQITL